MDIDSDTARRLGAWVEVFQNEKLSVAMGAQDELAAILRDAADAAVGAGLPVLTFDGYAEAAVAAGWRPAPTLITDPAELDGLPAGTVILDALGQPRQQCDNRWATTASAPAESQQVPLPATVLHIPS